MTFSQTAQDALDALETARRLWALYLREIGATAPESPLPHNARKRATAAANRLTDARVGMVAVREMAQEPAA